MLEYKHGKFGALKKIQEVSSMQIGSETARRISSKRSIKKKASNGLKNSLIDTPKKSNFFFKKN